MEHTIVIDGRQLSGQTGGVQRFIKEILEELDKIVTPGQYEILVPVSAELTVSYKNIRIHKYGKLKGLVWEQICLPYYLFTRRRYGLFPCTIVPLLYPKGIAILHDVMMAKCPELSEAFESPIAKKLLLLNYRIASKYANLIVTVSNFSKNDIMELYNVSAERIYVVGNAWQHIKRVAPDEKWKEKYHQLQVGEFYFSLSANRKQKNFKWIYEMAKRNPDRIFAMAGTQEEWQREQEYNAKNIVHLGYISDGEICSLMKSCKAFLFPSIYEGFGIPPMEALALGAKVIVANASCLPEIYRDCVYYIDPYDYEVDLDEVLKRNVAPADEVLKRYGWDISAKKLHEICQSLIKKCN